MKRLINLFGRLISRILGNSSDEKSNRTRLTGLYFSESNTARSRDLQKTRQRRDGSYLQARR